MDLAWANKSARAGRGTYRKGTDLVDRRGLFFRKILSNTVVLLYYHTRLN